MKAKPAPDRVKMTVQPVRAEPLKRVSMLDVAWGKAMAIRRRRISS